MFWAVFAAIVLMSAPAVAEDYLDDRSTPEAVVASLYNAINARDFARAWSYFQPSSAPSYSAYIRGFDGTERVRAVVGDADARASDNGARWHVPVVIEALQEDGAAEVFTGCYLVGQAPPTRRPPYAPIGIISGHFHVFDGPVEAAEGDCDWHEGD